MPDQRDQSPPPRSRISLFLSDFIQYLHELYLQVAGRLWQQRLQKPMTGNNDGIEIGESLHDHLEQTAAGTTSADSSDAAPDPVESPVGKRRKKAPKPASEGGIFSAMAKYFRRLKGRPDAQPHLAEKMREATQDHINRALILAFEGNVEGANMHAGLAKTAMETAGEYMDEETFNVFKAEVEEKIRDIKS